VNYFQLFSANKKILSFGVLLVFFSSFGQTFVVSLYIPWFLKSFEISQSFFSGMYALATLLSASLLIVVGQKIDHVSLKGFSLFAISGMIAACLVAALSFHVLMLFVALFMLRFFGQGLLSHTAMTTMGRYFKKARGKALSIAYLGFPVGEGLLPVLVVSLILLVGWRETLGLTAMLMLIVLLPLAVFLLKGTSSKDVVEEADKTVHMISTEHEDSRIWRKREVLHHPLFYLYAPTVFLIGFLQTSLFFFQTFIAAEKGWSIEWMAGSIMAYAIASSFFSIAAGPLIDRFSARKLFPYILIPLLFGLLVLSYASHQLFTPLFWLFIGISGGISSPVNSSLYAETFGTKSLGTVRSLFTFVMVFSTALGPLVYSLFLEWGLSFMMIHWVMICFIILNIGFILALTKISGSAVR
jgi:MFS family permease